VPRRGPDADAQARRPTPNAAHQYERTDVGHGHETGSALRISIPDDSSKDHTHPKQRLSPLRIATIYLVIGALWILFSDRLLAALSDDPATLTRLGTLKGWLYVLTTAGLLYALIRRAGETLEQRVKERTRELATLLAVSHSVVSTLDLGPLLDLILEQLQNVVDYTGASVLIREDEELVLQAHRGPLSPEQALGMRVFAQRPLLREAMRDQKPVVISDVLDDTPLALDFRAWASEHVRARPDVTLDELGYIRSWMGAPLTVKGRVIGLLALNYSEPDYYSRQDTRLVKAFADQAAVAIENARLYEQAEQLAVVEERQRLSRELQDSVTQALYGVNLYAEAARLAASTGKQDAALENLRELQDVAREAMLDMRMLIFELRPPVLEEEGLVAALQTRLASVEDRAGL
jgi:signal transduction histidine kinase